MRKTLCFVLFSGLIAVNATAQTAKPTAPAAKPAANNPAPVKKGKATPAANQVWVNGKVYHCPGTRYFGNTKKGEYMTEQQAIAAGATASHNKPCTQ